MHTTIGRTIYVLLYYCDTLECQPATELTGVTIAPYFQTPCILWKVGPDDATLLLGTRDSVPMVHCSTLSQGVASAGTVRVGILRSYSTLLAALATPCDSVEQCSMGTLSLVPRSKVASSGPSFRYASIVLIKWYRSKRCYVNNKIYV